MPEGPSGVPAFLEEGSLLRPFHIIAFDWDGTAVMSRNEDASPVRRALERLLELGVYVVVITGTSFKNIDRQLSAAIAGPHKQRLHISSNRGSEVFGFDVQSRPALIWRRVATREEDQLLTEIADGVRSYIEGRTGLPVRVIYNRLNRRKIDLIPAPEWDNPPKSAIGELLMAVEHRLTRGGLPGGLQEAFALTEKLAMAKGFPQARITTDVKHIEVGLTDKGDSIDWMMNKLAPAAGIPPGEILIGGDEFGPIAGFQGSDYKMVIPAARGAAFVSVGVEPNGAPLGVMHLGGGPARFLTLLETQVRLHELANGHPRHTPASGASPHVASGKMANGVQKLPSGEAQPPPLSASESTWFIEEQGFEPGREREVESIFTVGNGYVGTRGSLEEGSEMSLPATFLAGVFGTVDTVDELAIAPDWTGLKVTVEGRELRLDTGTVLEHTRRLDMRRGILEREWLHSDDAGRVTLLRFQRFVSLADRHALVESLVLIPENYSGQLIVESTVDGQVANVEGLSLLESVDTAPVQAFPDAALAQAAAPQMLTARIAGRKTRVAVACAGVFHGNQDTQAHPTILGEGLQIGHRWRWDAEIGSEFRVDKLVSIYTSRDVPDPDKAAAEHLYMLVSRGASAILSDHVRAWAERWKAADVAVSGDEFAQQAVRFASYHLIASANPEDERVSIAARGLTGEAYKGHVFWDTEIYMLPFFVFTHPPSARSNLMYRYHTLAAACDEARFMGYRGALYPWESTDTGRETAPKFGITADGEVVPILSGEQEHHISADVAYGVWQYWRATGDDSFFLQAGAEIILQTARFWASRGKLEEDGLYHILGVIGPDEYHETVDDNAFTNGMARWNLERAVETAQILRTRWPDRWNELTEKTGITAGEIDQWDTLARIMYTGFDPDTGLLEQFRGYFGLEYVDLEAYGPRTAPMDVLLGRERIARTQIIKQPDVLLLIYLLWDSFPPQVREANFRYYEPRCGHGSSLSPSIHALLAARLGDLALAGRYFRLAAEIDLANNMGNAAGGVHSAAQGGLWQAAVFGLGGARPREGGLGFHPRLLPRWRALCCSVQWRGRAVRLAACSRPGAVNVTLQSGEPLVVSLGDNGEMQATVTLEEPLAARRLQGVWRPKKVRS